MANLIRGAAAKANIGWITGRVVDLAGHSVPGAIVRWWGWVVDDPDAGGTKPTATEFTASSGLDGKFRLGIPAGPAHVLWCEAPGHARVRLGDEQIPDIAVFPDATNELGDIALPTENSIVGRVVGGDGLPIRGASVSARPYCHQLAHTIADNGSPVTAVVDDDGRFRIGSLPIGDVLVDIEVAGHASQKRHARFTHSDRLVELGEIRFVMERTEVRGRVVDEQGAPVAGARVHANEDKAVFALTDASGAFVLSARAAEIGWATVRKDGFVGYGTRVEDPQHVEFQIQRAFYLQGRVRDAHTDKVLTLEDLSICEVRRRESDGTLSYVG